MKKQELVAIERQDGVTLYGRPINNKGTLGQFEVYSPHLGNNGTVYTSYGEAKNRMKALIGVHKK